MKMLHFLRSAPVLAASALFLAPAPRALAQELTAKEKAQLEAMIDELDEKLNGGTRKNNGRALDTCRTALASTKATYEFFMNATKKLDFDEAGKRESDWREWRDRNEDTYKSVEHVAALQYQLRYIILSLEFNGASDREAARRTAIAKLYVYYNELAKNFDKLDGQQRVLRGDVTNSVFGRYLKLDVTLQKSEDWENSPLPVGRVYEKFMLPHFRKLEDHSGLQAAWDMRIEHEAKMLSTATTGAAAGGGLFGRGGMGPRGGGQGGGNRRPGRVDEREVEREREREEARLRQEREQEFVKTRLPELKWKKGVDAVLFSPDKTAAFAALGKLLRDNLAHADAQEWLKELKSLAKGGWNARNYYQPVAQS